MVDFSGYMVIIIVTVIIKLITRCTVCTDYSEYGEIDQDKVKAAVNTFMRSCAGYSVATYTLV